MAEVYSVILRYVVFPRSDKARKKGLEKEKPKDVEEEWRKWRLRVVMMIRMTRGIDDEDYEGSNGDEDGDEEQAAVDAGSGM